MPSVSSITSQYAKLQRKQPQKGGAVVEDAAAPASASAPAPAAPAAPAAEGGGLFSGIFGGNDKKEEQPVVAEASAAPAPAPAAAAAEGGGLFSGIFGGNDKKEEQPVVAEAKAEPAADAPAVDLGATEAPKKEESFLQKLGIAPSATPAETSPEPVPEPVPEPAPVTPEKPPAVEKKSILEDLKAAVGLAPSVDKKPDVEESESDDNLSSESESESDDDEDDNASDFKLIVDKMENLRKKYEDLKAKYKEEIKKKKEEPAASKDNTDFSNILASYFAIEGSVKQLKLYLKKHADNNGFPVEGLGLDAAEGEAVPEPEAPEAPESEAPEPEPEAPAPESVAPEAPESEAPAPESEAPEAPEAPEVVPVEGAGVESASESDASSGSESESESGSESESETSSIPEIQVEGSSPGADVVNANEEGQVPPAAPPADGGSNPLFSGGRNHFIQNIRKNKTHRHHKRRNRHQTLRNNLSK